MRPMRIVKWMAPVAALALLAALLPPKPAPAIERIAGSNFVVNESAINNGGDTRRSGNFIVWTDSIGEGVIGVINSTNFTAYTSFVPAATRSGGVPVEVSSFRLD